MAYSEEDSRRIVRQNALGHATAVVLACKNSETPLNLCGDIKELAKEFEDWVYREDKEESTCPTPTAEQSKALTKVETETGWTKDQVYGKFNKYPDMTNVDKCIKLIKEN